MILCTDPRCQSTVGCICQPKHLSVNWPVWAKRQHSPHYIDGMHAIRRTDNPHPSGSWEHEQWNRGYDELLPSGG